MGSAAREDQGTALKPLPPTWGDRAVGAIAAVLPWQGLRDLVASRQRQLLLLERQLQRRFLNEYRAQLKTVAPVLRARGRMVGEVAIDSLVGTRGGRPLSYATVLERSLAETPLADRLPLKDVINTLDPLMTPVLTPFVEGIKDPLRARAAEVKRDVAGVVALASLAAAGVGFVAGRASAGRRPPPAL